MIPHPVEYYIYKNKIKNKMDEITSIIHHNCPTLLGNFILHCQTRSCLHKFSIFYFILWVNNICAIGFCDTDCPVIITAHLCTMACLPLWLVFSSSS